MTDTMHTNGTGHDHHADAEVITTPRQRARRARAVIEAAADALLERHDGDEERAYVSVRALFAAADAVLLAPSDAKDLLDDADRSTIWQAITEARRVTGAASTDDDLVRQVLSHTSAQVRPDPPTRFRRAAAQDDATPAAPAAPTKGKGKG